MGERSGTTEPATDAAPAGTADSAGAPAPHLAVQVVLDCADPHAQCDFWAAALGFDVPDVDDLVARMLAAGHAQEQDTLRRDGRLVWRDGAACEDPTGRRPRMYFQRVPEPKTVKNRVHLDLQVGAEHRDALVERLEGLGARRLYVGQQGPLQWQTMADPEDNEFCVA